LAHFGGKGRVSKERKKSQTITNFGNGNRRAYQVSGRVLQKKPGETKEERN